MVIDGEVHKALALSMDDLSEFSTGHSWKSYWNVRGTGEICLNRKVSGTPWQRGAIACSEWTGVRLRDVLASRGFEIRVPSIPETMAKIFRVTAANPSHAGFPLRKAMDEHTLIALKMNGEVLPAAHGFPARLIVPGWIGSAMQKWLNRIWVRDTVHDSEKKEWLFYRVPVYPIAPGDKPPVEDMRIATAWQVKSLITQPQASLEFNAGTPIKVRGHAWGSENRIDKVMVSTDFGLQWQETQLIQPSNKYAWSHWETELALVNRGYYEIWARASDDTVTAQPFTQPWNPKGYLGNVIHRVPISIVA